MSNRRDFTKNNPQFTGTDGALLPKGSTGERPGSPVEGIVRYNTSLGLAEFYTSTGWAAVAPPPAVSSITGTINSDTDSTLTITGTGFDAGAVVSILGSAVSGIERTLVTTFVNSTSLTAATNASAVNFIGNASFDVKVTNTTGLSATLTTAGTVDRDPVWSTAAGSRGTFGDRVGSITVTHSATDPDGTSVVYSLASGSLPAGTSLNTSNGTVSGDPTDVGGSTTSSYTLRATSNGFNADRAFSITITPTVDGSTSARAFTELSDLANVYATDQSGLWYTYKGGLSAQQMSGTVVDFTTPSSPRFQTTATTSAGTITVNGINGNIVDINGGVGGCSEGTGTAYNWYNALRACMLAGYRLCTRSEIQSGTAQGTGCGHDANGIWTSTPGGAGYYIVQGNYQQGNPFETTSNPATTDNMGTFSDPQIGIRCCAPTTGNDFWTI